MRTRRFAIAAGLLVLAACNFDILNTNQPTQGDLLSNPTRDALAAAATGVMSSSRSGIQQLIWRLGSMGREGINLSGNNQPDYAEPYFGPVQSGGSFGGTLWLDRYQAIRTANIYLQALENNASLSGVDLLSPEERAASDFIDSGDKLRAAAPELALELGGALQALEQAHLQRGLGDFLGGLSFCGHGGD